MADIVYPGEIAGGPLNAGAMPVNENLKIYQGDYVELYLVLKDSGGTPMNLTGYTPKAQIKPTYGGAVSAEFECTVTANPGEIHIFLSSEDCAALEAGDYIWDFQLTSVGGTRTYLAGDVVVIPEVTT